MAYTGYYADSSLNVCIEDCYIATGDDLVAVKSGWDEYGIAYGHPSDGITIRRLTGSSPFAGIAIGSEASGGVLNVVAENVTLFNMGIGIHVKTNIGRGGIIRNITVKDVHMDTVRKGIKVAGDVGDHPDDKFNPKALPVVDSITVKNVWGVKVLQPGLLKGLKDLPFTRICLVGINMGGVGSGSPWQCEDVTGAAYGVNPSPCTELITTHDTNFCSVHS